MPEEFALLEIEVVTPHGEPVSDAGVHLVGGGVECHATEAKPGVYEALLPALDDYLLTVERYGRADGFDHRTLRTILFFHRQANGGASLASMDTPDGVLAGVKEIRREGGVFHVRVLLDYLWFTHIGYQPTVGNHITVLVDGEDGWAAVVDAISRAQLSLHVTTWIYQPRMELLRPKPLADPPEREPYTVHTMLEEKAQAGVLVRLLLWDTPLTPMPKEARQAARTPDDNLEVMQEANPTARPLLDEEGWHFYNHILGNFHIYSYHQKTLVVDGSVGFCTGMNLRENDWDSGRHQLFDPRRCRFSRPSWFRRQVLERLERADHRPRHDFIARVMGPAVRHLEENFRERWNRLLDRHAEYSENATPVIVPEASTGGGAASGSSQVQVVRTMPEPRPERGILDVYLRAISTARRLIYIEDQYFRSTLVSDAIADAVRAWPDLKVIVITVQGHADAPLAGSWARECFERIQKRRPDFELYSLRVGEVTASGVHMLEEVDNHAKLMIVDDLFVTVGSCNINDRGFELEGELNLAIVDKGLARGLRVDLWRSHLGGDARVTGDIEADTAVWKEHAEKNRAYDPASCASLESFVFPFVPRAHRTILFGRHVF